MIQVNIFLRKEFGQIGLGTLSLIHILEVRKCGKFM